jgi:hypothetical protein
MKRLGTVLGLLFFVVLPVFAQWGPTRVDLIRADYGSGNQWVEVTQRVRSLIRGESLNFRVDNNTLGVDPRPGQAKVLRLQIQDKTGGTRQLTFQENQYVNLRLDSGSGPYAGAGSGRLTIDGAQYGVYGRYSDVTARLNSQIQGDQLNLQVTNETMGGDPAVGRDKTLRAQYTYNGQQGEMVVKEGDYLRLPGGNATTYPGGNATTYQSNLQILRADYGAGNRFSDVTARLNSQIQGDQLNLQVTNYTMGGDPAVGKDKTLRIQYVYNGQQGQMVVNEGNYLRLPGGSATTYQSSLQILRADYGAGNRFSDVTARLNSQIQGDQLNLQVTNYTMGGDPAVGQDKTLRLQYTYNGQQGEMVVKEGNYLRLPANALPGSADSGTYKIIPSGTQLAIRTNEVIDSKTATVGQRFSAVMYGDVLNSSGTVAIPKGSDVELVIRSTAGSNLVLDIDSLVVAGQRYVVSTSDLEQKGGQGIGANRRTAEMVGGGAAVGAIIGAVVGGGKGAAIGAGVGAAGGAGVEILTKGKEVRVPAETVLNFKLDQDLSLEPVRW